MLIKVLFLLCFSLSALGSSMSSMVKYLASDALEGRKPGQLGNELATQFIEEKFKDLGLAPVGSHYRQEFTIFTAMEKIPGKNSFIVKNISANFEPLSYSLSGELKDKELVFAGFGISIPLNDPKIQYDDYASIDVKDKIVVVMSGDPGIGNSQSPFRHPDYINYRSLFYKLKNAITHGAVGFILIENPLAMNGSDPEPHFNASEGGGSRFSIIAGKTKISFVDQFLPRTSVEEIQQKIAQTQKPFSFKIESQSFLTVGLKKLTGRVSNINALIPGRTNEVVVIGAHMDHLGWGGESSTDPDPTPRIHNGADDNASGTALVIELAGKLKQMNLKKTYVFSLFNAEEMGLLGSQHFVSSWDKNKGDIMAMLNFDMVGRFNKEVSVMGTGSAKEWSALTAQIPTTRNFVLKEDAIGASDHASFIQQKIPALFFTTGAHDDYHRSTDDSHKINFKAMESIRDYALNLIKEIDGAQAITFNPNYGTGQAGQGRGYGASLGCIPKFGQSDQIRGVVCTGTSPQSPAQNAGMIAGDILVQIGEIEIKSVYDLAFALRYYRAGDKVQVNWRRSGTLMGQMVTLKKSSRG